MSIAGSAAERRSGASDAFASRGVPVLDTSEVRWFAPGPVPAEGLEWLSRLSNLATVDERCDTYLLHGVDGLGVKYRNQLVLEVKRRHSTEGDIALGPGMRTPLERWQKFHPDELDVVWSGPDIRRLDVHKRVTKAAFDLRGDPIVPAGRPGDVAEASCSIEIASVVIDGVPSWSLAMESSGPAVQRRHTLLRTWQAVSSRRLPDAGLISRLEVAAAYSDWLDRDVSRRLTG